MTGTTLEHVLEVHEELCSSAHELVATKGHDYNRTQQDAGDTLFNMRVAHILGLVPTPCASVLVRLCDKLMRLISLTAQAGVTGKVKEESVRDTIRDVINYAVYVCVFYEDARQEKIRAVERMINPPAIVTPEMMRQMQEASDMLLQMDEKQ